MLVLWNYKEVLEQGKNARIVEFESKDEQDCARNLFLLTAKPVLYVCNVGEADAKSGNDFTKKVEALAKEEGAEAMIIAAKTEEDIAELESYEDKQMFLEELGLEESGVNRLIKKAYALLNLETFITAGEMEVKAWTYKKGWKAPQCAGVIHTDFEKGFIRAEVIKYDDYIQYGSEAAVREAGKMGIEGISSMAVRLLFARQVRWALKVRNMWCRMVISCTLDSMYNGVAWLYHLESQ